MEDPLLSVIIPVYNGGQTLGRCLESIFKSSYMNFECIVVDDHSTDNTVSIAESFDTKVIYLERKRGAANARNRGAGASQGDILLFVDADVEVYPGNFEKVVKTFNTNPEISALFGSYDDSPGSLGFFSQYKNLFHHYIHQTSREEASTFWSAFGAIRKDVFFEIGGYNIKTSMMEDIELGYKLKAKNYKIRLDKDIHVKHLKHFSFSHLLKSDLFDRAIPWTLLMWKYRQFTDDLNLKFRHKFSSILLILLIAFAFMGFLSKWFLLGLPFLLLLYFMMNCDVYAFFLKKRGFMFSLKVIPLHILYYLYSMLGYIVGTFRYLFETISS